MKLRDLLLWVGAILIAVWLVGFFLDVVSWLLNAAVYVGGVLIIAWLIVRFVNDRRVEK